MADVVAVVSHPMVGTVPLAEMESVVMPGTLGKVEESDCAQTDATHSARKQIKGIGRFILFFI